jgi:hypothetical protein
MFKLASMFVDISARDAGLQSQLTGLRGQMTTAGLSVATMFGNLAAAGIMKAGGAAASFFSGGVSGAMELEDSMSAIGVIFGSSAGIITAKSDEMAAKFGVVKGEFLNAASSFGAAFKGAGSSQAEAANLGNTLAQLGMDMASFTAGATNQEAFTALQAALRGEFDPLERFNVFLSAAAVGNEALAMGLVKSKNEMTDSAKKQATLSLIMKGAADQVGDLERTADSSKNAWAKFGGTMTNLGVEMATSFMPAIQELIGIANEMAGSLASAFRGADFSSFVAGIVDGVATVGVIFRNFEDFGLLIWLPIQESLMNVGELFGTFAANVVQYATYIGDNWYQIISDSLNALGTSFLNLDANMHNFAQSLRDFLSNPTAGFKFEWTPLLEGFRATAGALPELIRPNLVSMEGELAAARDRITAREGERLDRKRKPEPSVMDDAMAWALASGEMLPEEYGALFDSGEKTAAAIKKGKKEFKSETLDSSDFSGKLRTAILSQEDAVPEKQLTELQLIRKAIEEQGAMASRDLDEAFARLG